MNHRDMLKAAWNAGAAHSVGSSKDFKQTHPDFEEWYESAKENHGMFVYAVEEGEVGEGADVLNVFTHRDDAILYVEKILLKESCRQSDQWRKVSPIMWECGCDYLIISKRRLDRGLEELRDKKLL